VEQLAEHAPQAMTYIDGGNANWIPPATMADRLAAAGVTKARGFSVNVSNFYSTAESDTYGRAVRKALASKHGLTKSYVVDTSRNGNGSNGEWCNPSGRKVGTPPRVVGLGEPKEFELWIKAPGESDGTCGAGPTTTAGEFSPGLAAGLIQGR
jgi:endoglucanase